jgi:YD repeat-containing protein
MSGRRTFLENAAAAIVMTKISSLRSFGFATDGPETIGATMSDREKDGLRGPVKQYTEETNTPPGLDYPGMKYASTIKYDPTGRILHINSTLADGSKSVASYTYDDQGHLLKTTSSEPSGSVIETNYTYDEKGRLIGITGNGERSSAFQYDDQGRKTVQSFGPTLKRAQGAMYAGSPWDVAVTSGIGVPVGGSITTIYDGNDQPTEAQIRDSEGRIVSRIVRSYDAHGRIIEEKQIEENPALIFADKFAAEEGPEPAAAQLEAMNTAMKLMLSGRSGTRISHAYDAQGRITNTQSHNFAFDDVTTISYNEHGDTSALHQTLTGNSTLPVGVPYSMDENGKLIPSDPAAKPTKLPDISGEVQYAYQYDSYGNWTEQTSNERSRPNEPSMVRHRTITYY